MTRIRRNRTVSTLAGLLAAAVLISSTGCGFCFGRLIGCPGSECCVGNTCRQPEECPAKSKVSEAESELATSSEADEPTH